MSNYKTDTIKTYLYQGIEVIIITVFKTTTTNSIAIVENVDTGEQFEIFRNQLS